MTGVARPLLVPNSERDIMARKTEELTAIFIRERNRWDDTTINICVRNEDAERYAKLEKSVARFEVSNEFEDIQQTVKCESEIGELEPGITYRFYGSWVKHWKYGVQFHAKTFTKITPHDKTGIVNYLMKAPKIGKKRAELMWSLYGSDAVRSVREVPEQCAADLGIKSLEDASAYLDQEKDLEDATIDLVSLLAGRGFSKRLPKVLIKKYGNKAAKVVRKNPYLLMREKGVGFLRADDMFLDLGGNPAKLKRQALAIWHGIENDSNGHTWFGVKFIEASLCEKLSGAEAQPVKAIKLALRSGLLAVYRDLEKRPWFCVRRMSEDEDAIADKIAWLATRDNAWPGMLLAGLSDHQEIQLIIALSRPVGIFAGDPGTGKSFTAARLVWRIAELSGYDAIAVVAPTGKAAVRVTEAMNECGADVRAKTVHSLLKVASTDGGSWSFEHNEENPIEERYVIVDESSMLDTPIMSSLIRAMRKDGHLLLVGDLQQLPPVGHGAPLRDLLKAKIPIGELTEIRRNSGAIVHVCQAIRNEQPPQIKKRLDLDAGINIVIRETNEEEAANRIESLVKVIRERKLCDATWELQVIVALNEKSQVARKKMNKSLQSELNNANRCDGLLWRDDKIVCLCNQMLPVDLDLMESVDDDLEGMVGETSGGEATAYIANGEIGRIVAIFPNKVVMEFFSPKRVVVCPRAPGTDIEGFDLGYAISCHKSQGSQWHTVIIALDPSGGARRVCDRSWIYTAISRAKDICFLVGKEKTLSAMCRTQKIDKRKTFLVERLERATADRVAADIEGKKDA